MTNNEHARDKLASDLRKAIDTLMDSSDRGCGFSKSDHDALVGYMQNALDLLDEALGVVRSAK
jgi:hypothetical protein